MLTISGKALGRKKPLFADWSIPFPPDLADGGSLTLRDLIGRVVRVEVEAFKKRQQERQLFRALTEKQIQEGATKGKIESGGSDLAQKVDADEAVATALEAFEDGLYLVVVDEQEQRSLDARVFLQPDSKVAFVRLVMLAGG
ncbi:MAG TPA: hypothetical protein VH643_13375 [Gemmataceae bacterium]|jgi:hypothetical protein